MINFLKEKIRSRKYLMLLKKYTAPDKDFSNKSRSLFINELKKRGVTEQSIHGRLLPLRKALGYSFASFLVFSSLTSGMVVYAQKQNVDPNHPLYPMKRLGENIQVKLAPAEKKPVIQDEIAQKRLTEIRQLIIEKEEEINLINSKKAEEAKQVTEKIEQEMRQTEAEDSQALQQIEEQKKQAIERIEGEREREIEKIESENEEKTEELNNDFHEKIDSVLKTIEPSREGLENKKRDRDLCESLRGKIEEHEEISGENERWSDFEERCAGSKEDVRRDGNGEDRNEERD